MQKVHMPPMCALCRRTRVARLQAHGRGVRVPQGADPGADQDAEAAPRRAGEPRAGGGAQHRERQGRQGRAGARDPQRRRAHGEPPGEPAQEQDTHADESAQQAQPGDRNHGGDDAGGRTRHQDQMQERAHHQTVGDNQPVSEDYHQEADGQFCDRLVRLKQQQCKHAERRLLELQRLYKRDRAAVRLEHIHHTWIQSVAEQGGPDLFARVECERFELATQGVPGRQRGRARQLSECVPRVECRPHRDLKVRVSRGNAASAEQGLVAQHCARVCQRL